MHFRMDMVVSAGKSRKNVDAFILLPPDARTAIDLLIELQIRMSLLACIQTRLSLEILNCRKLFSSVQVSDALNASRQHCSADILQLSRRYAINLTAIGFLRHTFCAQIL